ncbi:hypothetical protein C8R44DRAFT_692221, partial [Mycena epipterygia]
MSSSYSLLVQSADGISWNPGPLHRKKSKFYVRIYQDGVKIHRTPTVKGEPSLKWDDISIISTDPPSSTISLRLFRHSWLGDTCIGVAETTAVALAELCGSDGDAKVVALELMAVKGTLTGRPVGHLLVKLMKDREAAPFVVNKAQRDVENVKPGTESSAFVEAGDVVKQAGQVAPIANSIESALLPVISKLEILVNIGDEIAK